MVRRYNEFWLTFKVKFVTLKVQESLLRSDFEENHSLESFNHKLQHGPEGSGNTGVKIPKDFK